MPDTADNKNVIRKHFDDFAASWHELLQVHPYRIRLEVVRDMLRPLVQGTVVDVGCGTGDYCQLFDPARTRYIGADFSLEMVRRCKVLYPAQEFIVADGDRLDIADGFADVVLDIGVLEYYHDEAPHMRELRRITKTRGHLVIAVPNATNVTKRWNHGWGRFAATLRGRQFVNTREPGIVHNGQSIASMAALGRQFGYELVSARYANVMLAVEAHSLVGRFNRAVSQVLSGKRG